MTQGIDKRAIIDASAKLAPDVVVGPYSIIDKDVEIASGTWISSHVVIKGPTRIGKNNKIFQFSSIGGDPQDLKYQGGKTLLEIGDHNVIRECCTLSRGTENGGKLTKIGNHNLLMAYTHIAHDCRLYNHIVLANHVTLAGHVQIDNRATLGGFVGVHQFCRIGAYSFAAAGSIVIKDVVPFTKVSGYYAKSFGLNFLGLRRHKFTDKTIACLKDAYKLIYRHDLTVTEAIAELQNVRLVCSEVDLMIDVLQQSKRGIVR